MEALIRAILLIEGGALLAASIRFIGNRKIGTGGGVIWAMYSLLWMVLGIVPGLKRLIALASPLTALLVAVLVLLTVLLVFAVGVKLEELTRRDADLEIHYALLEERLGAIGQSGAAGERLRDGAEKEDSVCH